MDHSRDPQHLAGFDSPNHLIEPLNPRVVAPRDRNSPGFIARLLDNDLFHAHNTNKPSRRQKSSLSVISTHHNRNGSMQSQPPASPMETLANTALTTSPTFEPPRAYPRFQSSNPLAAYMNRTSYGARNSSMMSRGPAVYHEGFQERPAKRARSEALPSPQQQQFHSRPTTSHNPAAGVQYNVEQSMNSGHRIRQPSQDELEISDFMQFLARERQVYQQEHPDIRAEFPGFSEASARSVIPEGSRFGLDVAPLSSDALHFQALQSHINAVPESSHPAAPMVQTHTPPEDKQSVTPAVKASTRNVDPMDDVQMTASAYKRRRLIKDDSTNSGNTSINLVRNVEDSKPFFGLSDQQPPWSPKSMFIDDAEHSTAVESKAIRDSVEMPPADVPIRPSTSTGSHDPIPEYPFAGNSGLSRYASSPIRDDKTLSKIQVNPETFKIRPRTPRPTKFKEATTCSKCNFSSNATSREVQQWVQCNGCEQWFHFMCAGFKNERELRNVDKYHCDDCEDQYGPTTCKFLLASKALEMMLIVSRCSQIGSCTCLLGLCEALRRCAPNWR